MEGIFDLLANHIHSIEGFYKINKGYDRGVSISSASEDIEDILNDCDTITFEFQFDSVRDYECGKSYFQTRQNDRPFVKIVCTEPIGSAEYDRIDISEHIIDGIHIARNPIDSNYTIKISTRPKSAFYKSIVHAIHRARSHTSGR
jgi:hypothetical protein